MDAVMITFIIMMGVISVAFMATSVAIWAIKPSAIGTTDIEPNNRTN